MKGKTSLSATATFIVCSIFLYVTRAETLLARMVYLLSGIAMSLVLSLVLVVIDRTRER